MIDKVKLKYYTIFSESSGSVELPTTINKIVDWINNQDRINNNDSKPIITPADKARQILQKKADRELCLRAGICPECGQELIKLKNRSINSTEYITKCPIFTSHYCDRDIIFDHELTDF